MPELTEQEKLAKKLDKLARLEKQSQERQRAYLKRLDKSGKKQISAVLTAHAYDELCRRRDTSGQTNGEIISAILTTDQSLVQTTGDVSAQCQDTIDQMDAVLDTVPDSVKDSFPPLDTAIDIIDNFILDRHKKGGRGGEMMLKEIAQALMSAGIRTIKGLDAWKPGTVDTAFKSAIKRQEGK